MRHNVVIMQDFITHREVKQGRWKWLDHVLCTKKDRKLYAALTWAPRGKKGRGRPLGTWGRTTEAEMEEAGKNWNELRCLAQDRPKWKGDLLTPYDPLGEKRIE